MLGARLGYAMMTNSIKYTYIFILVDNNQR